MDTLLWGSCPRPYVYEADQISIRPDTEASFNADTAALQSALTSEMLPHVYAITVGSEALYRKSMTAQQLLSSIQSVQKLFPTVKVGTADSWNLFADGTADPLIKGGVKLL